MSEENEEVIETNEEYPPMQLTEEMQYYVFEAAKWAKMIGIAGFVFAGILALMAFSVPAMFSMLVKMNPSMGNVPGGAHAIAVFYFILAVVCLAFSIQVFQFSRNAKEGVSYNSEPHITAALSRLRSFFRLWGILVLVCVGGYILAALAVPGVG
jgi:hypothetical protein